MTKKRFYSSWFWVVGVLVLIMIICGVVWFIARNYCDETCKNEKYAAGYLAGKSEVPRNIVINKPSETVDSRDYRVIRDPLYPPLNRTDATSYEMTREAVDKRVMYVSGRRDDSFRLVGYLIAEEQEKKDSGGNSWKLFGRKVDSNRAEFYMMPTNNNYDVKVPINDDVLSSGYRLRSLDDIPNEIRFKTPLLNDGAYRFTELPKANLGNDGSLYL